MMQLITGFWDRLGIGISGLCAIHCLLTPVFVSIIPVFSTFEIYYEYAHIAFIFFIAPAVFFSLKNKHDSQLITVLMLSGLVLIILALFLEDIVGEMGEILITLFGSFLLITGHWMNYNLKRGGRLETT